MQKTPVRGEPPQPPELLQAVPPTLGEIVQFNEVFRYEMTFVDVR